MKKSSRHFLPSEIWGLNGGGGSCKLSVGTYAPKLWQKSLIFNCFDLMTKDTLSRSLWLKHLPSCFGVKEDGYALHVGPFRQQVTLLMSR